MNARSPRLVLRPRTAECLSRVAWDPESLTLSASVVCRDAEPARERSELSARINRDLGIEQGGYRLVVGELDMLLTRAKHLESLELRTNPATWSSCSLPPLPDDTSAAFVSFVAEHDRNRVATYDVPMTIRHDPARLELSIRFADLETSRWAAVTEGVAVGMTSDGQLSELRLAGVRPTSDPEGNPMG